ncbi:MAG TPA: hypothetical protein VJ499_14990, partial [Flavisolibacter sp.]|nr:hypothetical protein [Flavisolibacter sp.]
CLNSLSEQFCYHWIHADSALHYADMALRKASALGYKRGQAEAWMMEGDVQAKLLGEPQQMVLKNTWAINALRNTNDQHTLGKAYKNLA